MNRRAKFKKNKNVHRPKRTCTVSIDLLKARSELCMKAGYPKQKWVIFCEVMLKQGYTLTLYEAKKTVSKYITVINGNHRFKVRFSNHKPNYISEKFADCDFFVGRTHLNITTTEMAIKAVEDFFKAKEARE